MPRIVFTPSGLSGEVPEGTSVLEAARQIGADLDSVCSGRGLCGRCQVVPGVGSFAKWSIDSSDSSLSEASDSEVNYNGARPLTGRLGCMALVESDVVVDIPPMSQRHTAVVRKDIDVPDLEIDPLYDLAYIEVDAAGYEEGLSSDSQILAALSSQHSLTASGVAFSAVDMLHSALANDNLSTTVAIRRSDRMIVAAWPGFIDTAYGIAVDLGSTTIAANLCDLFSGEILASQGVMNPQIKLGEDLMSRVSYVMMNPGGDKELTELARGALDELVVGLAESRGLELDRVLNLVVVGNPIMGHILMGIDPTPLGQSPFPLATSGSITVPAPRLGLSAPVADVYMLPSIAGHVGADTAAVILSEGPHRSSDVQLLIDVGTNAEIVLGCQGWQLAASSPTGPAFEGAQISSGQRATTGAIERVRIDRETLAPLYKIIGSDLWSDEPGFGAEAAELGVTGVCGSGIIEVVGEMFLAGVIDADGVIAPRPGNPHLVENGRTWAYVIVDGDDPLLITQNDVRAIQLAKAALRAGIDLLVDRANQEFGWTGTLSDVRLAGAFGAHIDPLYAMVLGLVPDSPLAGVRSVGNAAGAGAIRSLLSAGQRAEIEAVIPLVTKIETATEPGFQDLFVAAMAFPHATASTENLASATVLPERTKSIADHAQRRRRRRSRPSDPGDQSDV